MKDNAEFIYNTKNITLRKYSNRHLDIIFDKLFSNLPNQ